MIRWLRFLRDLPELWQHHCAGQRLISNQLADIEAEVLKVRADLNAILHDPSDTKGYAAHKALSDKIGANVFVRQAAEDKARRHTTGEL